jgi:hypothetical protein
MRRWLLALWCLSALWLAGCAGSPNLVSQVSSYGSWPQGRVPGAYVFERLPSQQAQAALQDRLEAAAEPALKAAGFRKVIQADQAEVSVQLSTRSREDASLRHDPFWGGGRFGLGGWWGTGGWGGIGLSMRMEPTWVEMQVDVLIRDRRSNQVLYETHAVHDRQNTVDLDLLPYLFEAALKDFPHPAVSPRTVTVTRPVDNR